MVDGGAALQVCLIPGGGARLARVKPEPFDLLIIGAGPVGLFGAFYAGLRGLSMMLLDSLPEAGGQVAAMYPEKDILDVAGFARVRGRDLVDGLMAQTEPYHPQFCLGEQALELVTSDEGVEVTTDRGTVLAARSMLLTVGIGSFSPKPLPAAADWTGGGVVHFVPHPADARRSRRGDRRRWRLRGRLGAHALPGGEVRARRAPA